MLHLSYCIGCYIVLIYYLNILYLTFNDSGFIYLPCLCHIDSPVKVKFRVLFTSPTFLYPSCLASHLMWMLFWIMSAFYWMSRHHWICANEYLSFLTLVNYSWSFQSWTCLCDMTGWSLGRSFYLCGTQQGNLFLDVVSKCMKMHENALKSGCISTWNVCLCLFIFTFLIALSTQRVHFKKNISTQIPCISFDKLLYNIK